MPWALAGLELNGHLLEIGSGPGRGSEWLRTRFSRLTAVEIDGTLARSLGGRMHGTNVTVVCGDATALPFDDASFDMAVSFTMLHHVPSAELQDRLLAEACRVLRPGGMLAGFDSTPNLRWNLYHLFDTRVPVDPDGFPARLQDAGFADVSVKSHGRGFSFRACRPS